MDDDALATSTERLLQVIEDADTWKRLVNDPGFEDAYHERVESLLDQLDTPDENAVPVVLEEFYVEIRHLIKKHDPALFDRLVLPETMTLHRAPSAPVKPKDAPRVRAIANEVRERAPRTKRPR